MTFGNQSGPLRTAAGEADGGGSFSREEVSRIVNDEINKAMAAFGRKELPKLLAQQMESFGDKMSDKFMERLANELPSDEQIEMMEQGIDPETGEPMYEQQEHAEEQGGDQMFDPRTNAELYRLNKANREFEERLAQMEQAKTDAEAKAEASDRTASIQGALNKFPWANDESREMLIQYIDKKAQRTPDGTLVVNELPLPQFVEDYVGKVPNLLAPRQIGGSGAAAGLGRQKAFSMEDINPEMTPEKRNEIMQFAVASLKQD